LKKVTSVRWLATVLAIVMIAGPFAKPVDAAATVITHAPEADVMRLEGSNGEFGTYVHGIGSLLNVGIGSRSSLRFRLESKAIVSATLELSVQNVTGKSGHVLFMEAFGSADDRLSNTDGNTFPEIANATPFVRYNAPKDMDGTPVVPPGGKISLDVTDIVEAYTDDADRDITFILRGNEADPDSGSFSIFSSTYTNASQRPQLIVTYETPNNPPVATLSIEGNRLYTKEPMLILNIDYSDPDGDQITHMRFTENLANWPSGWENIAIQTLYLLQGDDGLRTIYMQVKDARGAISAPVSASITLDTTPPTGTIRVNGGAAWTSNPAVTLNLTYEDGIGTGPREMRLSNLPNSWTSGFLTYQSTYAWNLPEGDGLKTLYVKFIDAAGNESDRISTTISLDQTSPTGTVKINSGAANTNNAAVQLQLASDDGSGSGVTHMRIRNENQPAGSGVWENVAASKMWTLSPGDGVKTVLVEYRDAAGNESTDPISASILVDTPPPTVTGVADGDIYNGPVILEYNEGTATLNGAPFASGDKVSDEGLHTLVVTDDAGNVTTVRFEIDLTKPTGKIAIDGGADWSNNATGAVTLMFPDVSDDVAQLQVASEAVGLEDNAGWLPFAPTMSWSFDGEDGDKTVYARFKDKAGNISETVRAAIRLDRTAPTGSVVINEGGEWTNRTEVLLELTLDDGPYGSGVTHMRIRNEDQAPESSIWESASGLKTWELSPGEGAKTVHIEYRDAAGNVSVEPIQGTIKLDQTKPTAELKINGGDANTRSRSVTLTLDSSDDNGSGVTEMRFSHDQIAWTSWEDTSVRKSWLLTGGSGSKTVYAQVRDAAGNMSDPVSASIQFAERTPSGGSSGSSGGYPDEGLISSSNGRLILPAGRAGLVSLDNEIQLSIPTGATREQMEITIAGMLDTSALLGNKGVPASRIFEVLKTVSGRFSQNVTIKMTFDSSKLNVNQTVSLFYYDEELRKWVELSGVKIDGDRISAEVDHFTKFAVLVVDPATGLPVAVQPTDPATNVSLNDIDGHWAEAFIKDAVGDGIVTGYDDGSFKPDSAVTRAEFVTMLVRALKLDGDRNELGFADQEAIGAWARPAVAYAVQAGMVKGYEDGTFRPDALLTRAEMAVMLANALKLSVEASEAGNDAAGFTDDDAIPNWAKPAAGALKKLGLVEGKGDNAFDPDTTTTRAEAITVLLKLTTLKIYS